VSLEPDSRELSAQEEHVLDDVRAVLVDVVGEDYLAEMEIDMGTAFYGDLDIESIELVALAEALQEKYGDQVDFAAWIGTLEIDDIIALTVGNLVTYIAGAIA